MLSCDPYSDIWDVYGELFNRHWPDCPFDIFMASHTKAFSKYGFKTSSSKKERYGLEGKYTSEITNKGKVNYCIYTLNLEFYDFSENESLFAINLDGREGAPSVNNAINRSYRVLEKNIYSLCNFLIKNELNNI